MMLNCMMLTFCMPIESDIVNQYKLNPENNYHQQYTKTAIKNKTILITRPTAIDGYQTNQMIYTNFLYKISAFAHNNWIEPPADMLFPLIIKKLQQNYIATSTLTSVNVDYLLETQLITLQQNFLVKPSQIELLIKITLIRMSDNKILATRMFNQTVPCTSDTPYGGVLAANIATKIFLNDLLQFIRSVINDN